MNLCDIKVVKCGRLDINCGSGPDYFDGYPTTIWIDGKAPHQIEPGKYEAEITVIANAGDPLLVLIKFGDGTEALYQPEHFDLELGYVRVTKRDDRLPCATFIYGKEVCVYTLEIVFKEGEVVRVDLSLSPRVI